MTTVLDFVLPGLVRGTVGALVSPGGVGKSFWTLSVALAIGCKVKHGSGYANLAHRIDHLGIPVTQGRVVLFAAEDAEQIIAMRTQAMLGATQVNDEDFDYRDCVGLNIDVMVEDWFAQMLDAARGARLVILDTISRFHNLDENSAADAKRLMAQLERLAQESGAAVIYVHHTSKLAAQSGAGGSQQAARGSSVLVDNARWAAFLAPMSDLEAARFYIEGSPARYVRWNVSKQNYGAALEDVWYAREPSGVLQAVTMKRRKAGAGPAPPVATASLSETAAPALLEAPAQDQPQADAQAPDAPPRAVPELSSGGAFGGTW